MKHQLKFIVTQNISDSSSRLTLDHVMRMKNGDEEPIQDQDVVAMRKEFFAMDKKDVEQTGAEPDVTNDENPVPKSGELSVPVTNSQPREESNESPEDGSKEESHEPQLNLGASPDVAPATRKLGTMTLQATIGEKSDESEDGKTNENDAEERKYSVDTMSDAQMDRIVIWMQQKGDDDNESDRHLTAKASGEESRLYDGYKHHQFVKRWGLFFESTGKDEEWFIPSPEVLDESDPEYLCEMCRHIDFETLLTQRGLPGNQDAGPTSIHLYGLSRVLKESNCSFCSLVRRTLDQAGLLPDIPPTGRSGNSIRLNVMDEGPDYALRLEIEAGLGPDMDSTMLLQRIPQSKMQPLNGLTVRSDSADMDRLRGWLRVCEEDHPAEKTRGRKLLEGGSATLRLIDTVDNCICVVPMTSRYACLSYVWGTGTQAQLTTQTKGELETPGALENASLAIGQTIKDAMKVSREVGLRYLWVDALCIIQDDTTDKAAVIAQMSSIYGNAVLTIVASTNVDPSNGLPGVSTPRSREQVAAKVQGICLASAFHDPRRAYAEIEDSVWNSRAWTFQERHLSERSVYFTNAQMHFSCPHGKCYEDTVPVPDSGYQPPPLNEQVKLDARLHDLWMKLWTDETQSEYPNKAIEGKGQSRVILLSADPDNPSEKHPAATPIYSYTTVPAILGNGGLQIEGETLWRAYSDAVNLYTRRQLTWQSDATNAFVGVADLIAQGINTTFWHAIPEFAFDRALLWQPNEILSRRCDETGQPLFPSWSWAAWQGHSSYRGRGWHNAVNIPPLSVLRWMTVVKPEVVLADFMAEKKRTEEEIEAFRKDLVGSVVVRPLDALAMLHLRAANGWRHVSDKKRNEHTFENDAYPGIKFSYPVFLPGEPIPSRVGDNGILCFAAKTTDARFCDMTTTTFIKEELKESFLQIGLNDEDRSANRRRPWQHIIYHQGYRAGFLSLNLDRAELDLTAEDAHYKLVAVSRDSLPTIGPPRQGWQAYWQMDPRFGQDMIFCSDEWDRSKPEVVPPPDWTVAPDRDVKNENGDPRWDEGRFGDVNVFDIYNVLLLRRLGLVHERIGVGKVNVRAFKCAGGEPRHIMLG